MTVFQLELYSSSSSEVSSERQTDCSYYTDTSLALTLVRGDTGPGAGCRVALDTAGVVDIVQ